MHVARPHCSLICLHLFCCASIDLNSCPNFTLLCRTVDGVLISPMWVALVAMAAMGGRLIIFMKTCILLSCKRDNWLGGNNLFYSCIFFYVVRWSDINMIYILIASINIRIFFSFLSCIFSQQSSVHCFSERERACNCRLPMAEQHLWWVSDVGY